MSSRSGIRKKIVLPVSVIRHAGQEKALAHTLDLSATSVRLGGLCVQLEPEEMVEIQRGGMKARFQVFWSGDRGSAMEGQAGLRSLEPEKSIWGSYLTDDESASAVAGSQETVAPAPVKTSSELPGEKRWHTRYECKGSASVRAAGSTYPIQGEIKDVSLGGIYVESTTPLPVNTEVLLNLNIEGIPVQGTGVVRTSYPMVGMGICIQKLEGDSQENLTRIIENFKNKGNIAYPQVAQPAAEESEKSPVEVLAKACHTLAVDFDRWKDMRTTAEIQELRQAVAELQQKLAPPPGDIFDYLASSIPSGMA